MSSKDHLPTHLWYRFTTNREKLLRPWYKATASYRSLPDFVVIGAARSGSTNFFYTLRQHPQIDTCRIKEVSFFDKDERYKRGLNEYRSYFPLSRNVPKGHVVGEATPKYLYSEAAASRIAHNLPDVKLMALLRNPVDRAISHFFYKSETKSVTGRNFTSIDEFVLDNPKLTEEPIIARGYYAEQLQRYEKYKMSDNLKIFRSEDMFSARDDVLQQACEFLGIDSTYRFPEWKAKNAAIRKKPVSDEVRAALEALYQPHNQRLAEYLGTDVWW